MRQGVRGELAPWERRMAEARSKVDVTASERDLLLKRQADARQRFQVALVAPPVLLIIASADILIVHY